MASNDKYLFHAAGLARGEDADLIASARAELDSGESADGDLVSRAVQVAYDVLRTDAPEVAAELGAPDNRPEN